MSSFYKPGETVFIRARIVEACSDVFSGNAIAWVLISDSPADTFTVNTFAPLREIARRADLERLFRSPAIDPTTARPA